VSKFHTNGTEMAASVGLIALLVIGGGLLLHTGVLHRISNQDHLVALLRGAGWTAALLCIAVQFLQVVIAVIPGEVTSLAAGYVFGSWRGFLYSPSHHPGIDVQLLVRPRGRSAHAGAPHRADRLTRIDRALGSARSRSAMFLLFLLPGLPKDFLCYAAGLSGMGLLEFVVLSGLARSPALLASVLIAPVCRAATIVLCSRSPC